LGQGDANESVTGFQPVLNYLTDRKPALLLLANLKTRPYGYPALARVHCYSPDFPEELYFLCSIGQLYCSIAAWREFFPSISGLE
jgi:hypothetical protein